MIILSRTRAVRENRFFTLCASKDLTRCDGEWNKTIIVFSDHNKNEIVDADDVLLKAITLPVNTPCLEWNASARRNYLQFKPNGSSNGTAGHFRFCDAVNKHYEKKLIVSLSGRTSLKNL